MTEQPQPGLDPLYQLTLSESQIRTILSGLANYPYREVAQIIQSIDAQTTMQQNARLNAVKPGSITEINQKEEI